MIELPAFFPLTTTRGHRQSVASRSGRHLRSEPFTGKPPGGLLDPSGTVRASLLRAALTRQPLRLALADLQRKICQRQQQSLVVFAVDASESMATGARQRMLAARDAIFGLLTGAYQRRDQVALIAFRGEEAEVLLPPTSSIALARERLRHLAIGGATPFTDGLQRAQRLIAATQRRQPLLVPTLIIISDGEANVPLKAGGNVMDELWQVAAQLAGMKIAAVILDTSTLAGGSHVLRRLAQVLGAAYQRTRDLHARQLYRIVRRQDC